MDSHQQRSRQIEQMNTAGHLHRFSRLLSSLSEHRWASDGYSDVRNGHVQLLNNLDPEGTRNTVLAQRAQITKQTMGRLVKELTASGYVMVSPDPADQRAQQVQLTGRGQAFLGYLATTLQDLERAFTGVVGAERLADFTTTLHDLLSFAEGRQPRL